MKTAVAGLALLTSVAGCGSTRSPARGTAALERVDRMEIYSLDPRRPAKQDDAHFHGYLIRGHATVDDPAERRRLADALRRGSSEHVKGLIFDVEGATACRANPHHGLRVEHAGVTTDYVICFECSDTYAYSAGRTIPPFHTDGTDAKAVFDDALRRAGLPTAAED